MGNKDQIKSKSNHMLTLYNNMNCLTSSWVRFLLIFVLVLWKSFLTKNYYRAFENITNLRSSSGNVCIKSFLKFKIPATSPWPKFVQEQMSVVPENAIKIFKVMKGRIYLCGFVDPDIFQLKFCKQYQYCSILKDFLAKQIRIVYGNNNNMTQKCKRLRCAVNKQEFLCLFLA